MSSELIERRATFVACCNFLGEIVESMSASDIEYILDNASDFILCIREFLDRGDDL